MDYLQNIPSDKQYTLKEFADCNGITPEAVRQMLYRGNLPIGYEVIRISERKRIIVEKEALNEGAEYVHPSKLAADVVVKINNCLADDSFIRPSGKPNIKKIAEYVHQHYWTVKRFIENDYKKPSEVRADKGVSRKFKGRKKSDIKKIKRCFEHFFQSSAQQNLQQALRCVKNELGEDIPVRLATEWRHALLGTHTMKHYYKTFIKKYTPHLRLDKWGETGDFLDVVEVDVWPVDVPYVDDATAKALKNELQELKKSNIKAWEKQRTKACQAECLAFIDRKTRFPLQTLICPHSVSGSDVKKGLMLLFREWGAFKQLYIDNGREFFNDEVVSFLYGILSDEFEFDNRHVNIKVVELKQEEKIQNAQAYQPYGKGLVERMFKTLKDRWAVYHEAYSPNQKESRKPSLKLSAVQPTLNFNELGSSLKSYIDSIYIYEERPEMFLDPGRTKNAEVNQDRPRSIAEAFERAYQRPSYERRDVDSYLLAFHYAEKKQATFREGICRISYKTYVLRYIPDNVEAMIEYAERNKAVTVMINPANIYEAWFFCNNKLITRAEDHRFNKDMGVGIERATYIQKKQNQAVRAYKKAQKLADEFEAEKNNDVQRVGNKYSEEDFNPSISIVEKDVEYEEVEGNEDDSLSIWDLDD